MKHILWTVVLMTSITQVFTQDCRTLNSFNSFHGITFGQQFADSTKKYFEFKVGNGNNDTSYKNYSLTQKMLSKNSNLFDKFYKWFHFGDNSFSNLAITCLPDGRVYDFDLSKIYDKNDIPSIEDSIEVVNKRLPKTFVRATEEITSLFGEMTKTENKNDILGYHLYRIWECEKNKIELRMWYNYESGLKFHPFTLLVGFSITDKELEKLQKLNTYKK